MTKITVLDACMGNGKTTKLIDIIDSMSPLAKILYITPLLSECHRIAGTVATDDNSPVLKDDEYHYDMRHKLANRRFRHPQTIKTKNKTKLESFQFLVSTGCNIVSTHSLFSSLTLDILAELKRQNYVLILDEVISVYEPYDGLSYKTLKSCFENQWLYLDSDGITLQWNHSIAKYDDVYDLDEVGRLCDTRQLLLIDGRYVMSEFSTSIIEAFHQIYIATYMFEGSQMCKYLVNNQFDFEINRFGDLPSSFKSLITIIDDPKMNAIGDETYALSKSDYMTQSKTGLLETIHKKLNTFYYTKNETVSSDRMWTSFKSYTRGISKGRYASSWVACNTKATNKYANTWAIAYLINVFPNPMIAKLLCYRHLTLDESRYALCEMIQYIFRSRIRNRQPITVYIPSKRMRSLFMQWLNDEFI